MFIEPFTLAHPDLPAELEGLTILHLSDFHVRFPPRRHRWFDRVIESVRSVEADLVAFTGDVIDRPRHEALGLELLGELSRAWRLKPGGAAFGIFGNHDAPRFRRLAIERAAGHGLRWIGGQVEEFTPSDRPGAPVRVLGLDHPEDFLAAAMRHGLTPSPSQARPLLTLAHEPTALVPGAMFGLPIMLCGHTHGGQVRLSPRFAPHTSSDTPGHLAAGVIRLDRTLCAISRGIGDGVLEGLRFNCPRQIPLYTLARGEMAEAKISLHEPAQVVAW